MLTLLLSAHDGGTAWRHLLAEGEARAGFEPVGPLLLARRVGRLLGVPAEAAGAPERLAAWTQRLDAQDDGKRSYSESRRQDPFGVARFLLALRDDLRMAGWDARPLTGSARLQDLSQLEGLGSPLPPGHPEILRELIAELEAAKSLPCAVRVELASPRNAFAPLVRRLLEALVAAGAEVREPQPHAPLAEASTDLGRVQRALLDPKSEKARLTGDGSLLLLEADTPIEAAELTASFARTRPLAKATFVVAAEPATLDAAMARQGLPTLGLSTSSALRPHLQVLPLRLTLAFKPQDPFRAAELLLLAGAPLAGHARRKLLAALGEMPGVGSPAWREAVDRAAADETAYALERKESQAAADAAGDDLRARIDAWFGGELHDPVVGIPAAKAAALCAEVAKWAGGRVRGAVEAAEADPSGADDDSALWAHAAAVARTLEQLLVARPAGERASQRTLLQLHELAVGSGSELSAFEGEAGRPAVAASSSGVSAPAAELVWWGFVHAADVGSAFDPWTAAERERLTGAGISLPADGEVRGVEAEGWRLPILHARERAVLVRWRLVGTEPVAPHAFHDELSTHVAEGSLAACTVASERLLAPKGAGAWAAATEPIAPRAPLPQRPVWKVPPQAVAPTGPLSASQLEELLKCPFRWVLSHRAKLEPGAGVDLPSGGRLLGDFAHRILQSMLCGEGKLDVAKAKEADARAWARKAFDERVGLEAAPLVRRGGEVELDRARSVIEEAAAALLGFLKRTGWKPVDAEREVGGSFAGLPATGYIDLVVEKGGVEGLVDLKLGGLEYRKEELEAGHGLQLALYASMLGKRGKPVPPSGFFILEDGQFLTTEPVAFPGATVVEGPGTKATLEGAEKGFAYWSGVMAKGILPVLHEQLAWEAPVAAAAGPPPPADTPARRPGPCKFCDYTSICVPPLAVEEEAS